MCKSSKPLFPEAGERGDDHTEGESSVALQRQRKGGNMPDKNWLQRLAKSRNDRWIGGVCGGLGAHTSIPSWVWRVLFCLLFFCLGTGLLIYILLWIFMPNEQLEEGGL